MARATREKILVTGGAGFIGSNFCNLNQDEYDITVLDNLAMGDPANIHNHLRVRFIEGDACELDDLMLCGQKFDYVIHLAGTSTAPKFQDDGFVDGYVNSVKSFVQTLEFARKAGAKKFLFASTSSLYGNNPTPLTEDQVVTPPNHYSVTKHLYENCSRCYQKVYSEIEIMGFRFMSVYGPNEEAKGPYANIISQFIWDLARGREPIIYGDGTQTRDFTNVLDIVRAISLAIKSDRAVGCDFYNVGTGEYASLNDIIGHINDEFKKQGIKTTKAKYIPNPVKENYIAAQHADITKIRKTFGYSPTVSLKQGIADQVSNIRIEKIRKTSSDLLREADDI